MQKLSEDEVNKRWEAKMDEFFDKTGAGSDLLDGEWLEEYL